MVRLVRWFLAHYYDSEFVDLDWIELEVRFELFFRIVCGSVYVYLCIVWILS